MSVVQMSSQTPSVRSLIVTEIASMYHSVVDGRRVGRRLIKNKLQLHLYTVEVRPWHPHRSEGSLCGTFQTSNMENMILSRL